MDSQTIQQNAQDSLSILKALANAKRLAILCHLNNGEKTVSELLEALGKDHDLSQSSLSQHLARMKEDGIVTCRRNSRNIHYSLKGDKVQCLLRCLHDMAQGSPKDIPVSINIESIPAPETLPVEVVRHGLRA